MVLRFKKSYFPKVSQEAEKMSLLLLPIPSPSGAGTGSHPPTPHSMDSGRSTPAEGPRSWIARPSCHPGLGSK